MTSFEELIYNKYIAVSRSSQNKPFRLRKDFTDFESTEYYAYVKKLSYFFTKFPHINLDDFFKAPYEIYKDTDFDLKFYISQRALKVYTLFNQKTRALPPDSDEQLYGIKKSLQYILTFCNNQSILIDDYISHKSGGIPSCALHLKQCKVTMYTLLGFNQFEKTINSSDIEYIKHVLGDIYDNIPTFRTKFISSKIAKKLSRVGIDKIRDLQSKNSIVQ